MSRHRKTVAVYEAEAEWSGECLIHPAHGVARKCYKMRHGALTTEQYVCHRCDNPFCIRDEHHFIGSCGDNVRDAVAKGRHSCFRKGGVRFSGTHTPEVRKKISEASNRMWESRRENKTNRN